MIDFYFDSMRGGLKAEWEIINNPTAPTSPNQVEQTAEGVKLRNDQFDGCETFGLLLNLPKLCEEGRIWGIGFLPGELSFGKMAFYLHNSLTMSMTNTDPGPFGISQDWDPQSSRSYLYMQHGSSNPVEETKIEITDPSEAIYLILTGQDDGTVAAYACADQFSGCHEFGVSNQDTFGGVNLYPAVHNCKSWNSTNGANHWRDFFTLKF